MKGTSIIITVLIVVAVIVYGYTKGARLPDSPAQGIGSKEEKTYSSDALGLSFRYPANYFLEEKDLGGGGRTHRQISLFEDTEWNRKVRTGEIADTEGPTSITIDTYQNDLDKMTARGFIVETRDSNYKLGSGNIATATRGGIEGLEYSWSGLYEGKSFVAANRRYIYMFSVTRLDPGDAILKAFDRLMDTVQISG